MCGGVSGRYLGDWGYVVVVCGFWGLVRVGLEDFFWVGEFDGVFVKCVDMFLNYSIKKLVLVSFVVIVVRWFLGICRGLEEELIVLVCFFYLDGCGVVVFFVVFCGWGLE